MSYISANSDTLEFLSIKDEMENLNENFLSICIVLVQLNKYIKQIDQESIIKIYFNQKETIDLEVNIDANQTFQELYDKINIQFQSIDFSDNVEKIEWVIENNSNEPYTIEFTESINSKTIIPSFFYPENSFFKLAFRNGINHYNRIKKSILTDLKSSIKNINYIDEKSRSEILANATCNFNF